MLASLKRGSYYPAFTSTEYLIKPEANLHSLALSSDEYCPHCDNHFVLDAVTPQASLQVEGDDARMDNRCVTHNRLAQSTAGRN